MTSKNPPMITGLDHLVLTVSDMVTSVAFYRDILGMQALEFEAANLPPLAMGSSLFFHWPE